MRKNKYGNRSVVIDGIRFDSKHEGERYCELKMLEKAHVISELRLQEKFELQPAFYFKGEKRRAINYVADFTYKEGGHLIIEDAKGVKTQAYLLKKKMMEYRGYEIREV